MPGGITFDESSSYITYGIIKLIGYCGASLYFQSKYPNSNSNFLLVGITRTMIGMLFGGIVGVIGLIELQIAMFLFLICLIPIRFFEWWIVLKVYFYNPKDNDQEQNIYNLGQGVILSFMLDFPAICGFLANGGFWIC
jgi:uncharacterized membrane protein YphA (DoxX/SURF4 family)